MRVPARLTSEAEVEDFLSEPHPEDLKFGAQLEGDVMVLGAGGKMGPTLVQRIARACNGRRVYAVSRFSDPEVKARLDLGGITTICADLLDESDLSALPECPNVIYMVGMKFGSTGQQDRTWAMNVYLPGRIAERLKSSRIVAFSTGNVYPLVAVDSGGSQEADPLAPIGDYAQSCLGRERVLRYFSGINGTPMCILRLNYSVEPRYGVLLDIGMKVYRREPVGLEMGHVNVIWQGDANSVAFRALGLCRSPAEILNVTGRETLSVRWIADRFAQHFGCQVRFQGRESPTALLNNAQRCHERFKVPRVSVEESIDLVAHWIESGGSVLDKPTRFEVRDGMF